MNRTRKRTGYLSVRARHGTDLVGCKSLHQVFVDPKVMRRVRLRRITVGLGLKEAQSP